MTFSWADYLNLAQTLLQEASTPPLEEAKLRSAISRAYFAAHCRARNDLRDQEGRSLPSGGAVHGVVINRFLRSPDRDRRRVGRCLEQWRIARIEADYYHMVLRVADLATRALEPARRVFSGPGSLIGPP